MELRHKLPSTLSKEKENEHPAACSAREADDAGSLVPQLNLTHAEVWAGYTGFG